MAPATGEVKPRPELVPLPPQPTELTKELIEIFVAEIQARHDALQKVDLDWHALGPWSPSKLKTLEKCPFQFYLRYLLKFKVPESLKAHDDPVSANVGKAAHQILEDIVAGKSLDRAYADTKRKYLKDSSLNEAQWEEHVETLNFNITQFKDRMEELEQRHPVKRIFTELRIGINKNYEPVDFFADDVWVRGVVDLILLLECMDIIIIDHKTGGGEGSINPYKAQLDWYKILFHYGISKIEGAQTGIHFIKAGEIKMATFSHAEEIEGKLRNTLEMSIEGAIDSLISKGYFKHVRGSYCKWCEYDAIGCKDGTLKPLELSTRKWIPINRST